MFNPDYIFLNSKYRNFNEAFSFKEIPKQVRDDASECHAELVSASNSINTHELTHNEKLIVELIEKENTNNASSKLNKLFNKSFKVETGNEKKESKDTLGPQIRLNIVKSENGKIQIKGNATDSESQISSISFKFIDYNGNEIDSGDVLSVDGKFDQSKEDFNINLSDKASGGILYLDIKDEKGNISSMKILLDKGKEDKINTITFMSKSALNINCVEFDNCKIYYTNSITPEIIEKAKEKILRLKDFTHKKLGLTNYDPIHILIYNPQNEEEKNTFQNYRGIMKEGIFTYPLAATNAEDVTNFNKTLDDWIPHELGDHSTRGQFNEKSQQRWLSEGIGDYILYSYQKEYYPEKQENAYDERVSINKKDNPADKTVNLVDGKWDPAHYLCSASFVRDLIKRYGEEILQRFFSAFSQYPKEQRTESLALKILKDLTGDDFEKEISNYSTQKGETILNEN